MSYELQLDFNDTNNIPISSNQWRMLPRYRETEGEVFLVNDFSDVGDPVILRKLDPISGNFQEIYNDVYQEGSDYAIGIADIIKLRTNWDNYPQNGYCGYAVLAYFWSSDHVSYGIYYTQDISDPFSFLLYYDSSSIEFANIWPTNRGINFYRYMLGNTQVNYSTSLNYLCEYIRAGVSFNSNEIKTYDGDNYYRLNGTYHQFRGSYFNTSTYTFYRNSLNAFISDDRKKIVLEHKSADDLNWRFDIPIFDGDYMTTPITIDELIDKTNMLWANFGPAFSSPYPSYTPFYWYTPITSNQWTTPAVLGKTGIYSITSSQGGARNWSIYLLYSDEWPNGILGGTYYNNKLYVLYRNGLNVYLYSQNGYWIDDQETNNTSTPYYKEVQFNTSNFTLEAGPITVNNNVVLGGIAFYGNKINILLNEVS